MFRCRAGHITEPNQPMLRIIEAVRDKEYVNDKGKVSYGWEIVREASYCEEHGAPILVSTEYFDLTIRNPLGR